MTKVPEFLYHAAPQCAEDAIAKEGLLSAFDGVYMADDPQHCMRFMADRLLAHIHGIKQVDFDGRTMSVPDVVLHDYVPVFQIRTADLDLDLLEVSTDHSPEHYGEEVHSYVYRAKQVPASALESHVMHMAVSNG